MELLVSLRDQSLVESCRAELVFGTVKGFGVENLARLLSGGALQVVVVGCDAWDISHISRDHTSLARYWGLKDH